MPRPWASPLSLIAAAVLLVVAEVHPARADAGAAALAKGDYPAAEKAFTARAKGPRAGAALLGLARVQLATGRYAQAAATAERAARHAKQRAAAHTARGEALQLQGKLDAAQRAFEQALRAPPALRARVLLGRLLQQRGRHGQAEPHLRAVIEAYNDDRLGDEPAAGLAYVAMAARALGSMHDANDAFREAAMADRTRSETQLEWAGLFLEKYDQRHASESISEALAHNPNYAPALVLKARLALKRSFDFPTAEEQLRKALAINPNLVGAHVTRATMDLRNMELERADGHLDRALKVNPHDLEALSVRAAVRFLADDTRGFERAKREVLRRNPRFSRMYSIIAEYADWEHRYDELVKMARAALKIDPDDALAHATLGTNLLRTGDEKGGLAALHEAWDRDRFNVHVFNTLNLFDEVIAKHYERYHQGPFAIRVHKDERKVLEPYLVPMLQRAHDSMVERYRFTPRGPLHLELYADRQHFSVRTTGLPNVGVQGVCFGKVITALSPRGGPFNWGQITWHELAHVFHLQLSKNHVPRWFTEGLAEYETIIARPEWRREEDHNLWVALQQDQVPHLRDLNRAFTSARTPQALMTAYYAASLAVTHIVERFGFEKVRPMLVAWGDGKRTPEVVSSVLGVDIEELDRGFRAYLKKRLARYEHQFHADFSAYEDLAVVKRTLDAAPEDPDALGAYAMALVMRRRFDEAQRFGMRAIEKKPHHAIAHFALTRVALEHNKPKRAARCLRAIIAGGQDGYVLRVLLARGALAGGDPRSALPEIEAAIKLDPDQAEAYRIMLDLSEKLDDDALARRALTALGGLDQHDRLVHFALLTTLAKAKDWAEVERVGDNALYIDPENSQVHRLLGEALIERGKPARALGELDQALTLGHPKPGVVELLRARALWLLGRKGAARKAADRALKHDAELRERVDGIFKN